MGASSSTDTQEREQMNGYADLHIHTTASDGTRTIDEVAQAAKACALRAIAITDHDVVAAELTERVSERHGLELITGVEIKAVFQTPAGEVTGEILGYFVDPTAGKLRRMLDALEASRVSRMKKMVELCREHAGADIVFDEVRAIAQGNIGRPHLARVLIDKGVVGSFEEAFGDLLTKGKACYWPIDKPDHLDVIEAVHDAGGLTSLAHPCLMKVQDWEPLLEQLKADGLDAIEVFYPYGAANGAARGLSMDPPLMKTKAAELGFLLSGGSDDHGRDSTKESLGSIRVDYAHVQALKNALPASL